MCSAYGSDSTAEERRGRKKTHEQVGVPIDFKSRLGFPGTDSMRRGRGKITVRSRLIAA